MLTAKHHALRGRKWSMAKSISTTFEVTWSIIRIMLNCILYWAHSIKSLHSEIISMVKYALWEQPLWSLKITEGLFIPWHRRSGRHFLPLFFKLVVLLGSLFPERLQSFGSYLFTLLFLWARDASSVFSTGSRMDERGFSMHSNLVYV